MIEIVRAGVQMTLQGAPLIGFRHLGFPACGAADPLSMALANYLVGQDAAATSLEITYGGAAIRFSIAVQFAVVGASADLLLNEQTCTANTTLIAAAGDVLSIGPVTTGARIYLAVAGAFEAETFLGTQSTYLPARLGGFHGRRLRDGDVIAFDPSTSIEPRVLSQDMTSIFTSSFALRATRGPDLEEADAHHLFGPSFDVSRRASRMGVGMKGAFPIKDNATSLPSAAVFPGTLQAPSADEGFLLLVDGQTTGGYPHLLQVNRSDRHLLGQLKPGDRVQFLRRSPDQAARDLASKQQHISQCLPDFRL